MKIKALVLACGLIICGYSCAEEAVTVQATPKIQAANLSPIETQSGQQVIQLKAPQEVSVKVQATPVVPQEVKSASPQPIKPTQQPINQTPVKPVTQPITQVQNQVQAKPVPQQITPQKPQTTGNALTTPININIEACSKMYAIPAEQLFLLTLGGIEANGFEIKEIQSRGGYVLFNVGEKEFLATVAMIDNKNAMLRINPTNGIYHFAPGIVAKLFEYVEYKLD